MPRLVDPLVSKEIGIVAIRLLINNYKTVDLLAEGRAIAKGKTKTLNASCTDILTVKCSL